MASINDELTRIKTAVYGEDVRKSIHDAIEKINQEVEDTTSSFDDKLDCTNVAPVEPGTSSTHAYKIGEHFILNGVLYIATSNIAVNDTITVGTNCKAVKVGEEVSELKSHIDVLTPPATDSETGGLLTAKAISNGKVTEYQYTELRGFDVSQETHSEGDWPTGGKIYFSANLGYIKRADGTVANAGSSTWIYSDFIPIDRIDGDCGDWVGHPNVANIAYYSGNSFDDFLGYWAIPNAETTKCTKQEVLNNAPNGTTHLIVCTNGATQSLYATLTPAIIAEVQIIKPKKMENFAHFSFDDSLFWVDLMVNSSTYTSIFENAFLADLKDLHERFGCVFSLFVFLDDGDNHLFVDMPSTFADEFRANKSWLKFGFHGRVYPSNYLNDDGTNAAADYADFTTGVLSMTGDIQCIDKFTRLGGFGGSLAACTAFRDADGGVNGLYTADLPDRQSYYLTADQIAYMYNHCHMFDAVNQLHFVCSQIRLERGTISPSDYNTLDFANFLPMLEFFTHETVWSSTLKNTLASFMTWLNAHGFAYEYPENIFR